MKAFFNDEMMEFEDVSVSPNDLIVQRGFGIFDFFRIVSGKPLFTSEHLDRFIKSAELTRLPLRWTKEALENMILRLIAANKYATGGIKIMLTGGVSPMGFEVVSPNLIIIQNDAKTPELSSYSAGANLIMHDFLRDLPSVKTTNYFNSVWLFDEMQKHKAIDVLYHQNDCLSELSRSNIFLVKDGKLLSPAKDILQGITRGKVLEIARGLMPVEVRDIRVDELREASEVFITSTLKKVMPIVKIDEFIIGAGKPGEFTQLIMKEFERVVKQYTLEAP